MRETLLSNKNVCRAFLGIKQEHAAQLGKLATELDSQVTLIKGVNSSKLVPAELLKKAKDLGQFAVETAVFRFVIKCVKQDWRTLLSVADCIEAVTFESEQHLNHKYNSHSMQSSTFKSNGEEVAC